MDKINLVALIDDDEITNYIGKKIIEKTNLVKQIKVFSNAKEALDFLVMNASNPSLLPEIIFLDINMPGMDGFEFLEEFEKFKPVLDKKITIYIVSSSVSESDHKRMGRINEVSGFVLKPITKEKFESIAKSFTENEMK